MVNKNYNFYSFFLVGVITLLYSFSIEKEIYDINIPKAEGGVQSLGNFSGKKIMIITLPINTSLASDSLLYSLDSLARNRTGSLQVIAVPAIEDGFNLTNKSALMQWYRQFLGSYIVITDGIYCRKGSSSQHPLFKWLTNIDENEIFEYDVEGPNFKYFVNTKGKLFGLLKSEISIKGSLVQKLLSLP